MGHLTVAEARRLFCYDPETGIIAWRQGTGYAQQRSGVAGYIGDDGRVTIRCGGRLYLASRLAWAIHYGRWPRLIVDHKDGNPSNNRIANLRLASKTQNQMNQRLRKDSSSGLKGVTFHKKAGKWCAQITAFGRRNYLGLFSTPEEAHAAYCEAAARLHGEFARVR